MFGITDLSSYLLGTFFIVLLPGPNSIFTLSVAAKLGVRAGYAAAAGIVTGDLILMLLASVGVASLMHTHPATFDMVRYAGAAYLAWMGFKMLLAKPQAGNNAPMEAPSGHIYKQALSISLVNVKAILFFMAFFPQFVDPAYDRIPLTFAILGMIVQAVSLAYLTFLIFAGAGLSRRLAGKQWLSRWLARLTGVLFISFGARLALTH
ncbi:leucine efflux protein LeuE [Iodobacter ciconiae]|uniref:Leucine efflux protein LeuE n=1 Tax=Iodobacter ciconiae TaxID=2496266 RepID=A0A3S8ZQD9_9NEIS|nr:leucine efflux protein LeuE [Iodobacter ciconiae]AZN35684.1 leucine efflux protein LeuE [Iodobacter ciconiae]